MGSRRCRLLIPCTEVVCLNLLLAILVCCADTQNKSFQSHRRDDMIEYVDLSMLDEDGDRQGPSETTQIQARDCHMCLAQRDGKYSFLKQTFDVVPADCCDANLESTGGRMSWTPEAVGDELVRIRNGAASPIWGKLCLYANDGCDGVYLRRCVTRYHPNYAKSLWTTTTTDSSTYYSSHSCVDSTSGLGKVLTMPEGQCDSIGLNDYTSIGMEPLVSGPAQCLGWRIVDTGLSFPRGRHEACFVTVGSLMYLIGGRGIQPVNVYDPFTQTWTWRRGPLKELHHMQCVSVGTEIWIASSWTGSNPERLVDKIYVYDTVTDTWDRSRPALPADRNRGSAATVYHDGHLYVSHGNRGGHGEQATTLNWLDKYNIATGQWTALPPAPNARDHTGGAVVDGELCVAGGRDGGVSGFFNAVVLPTDCFDFATETWSVKADIPQGRGGSAYGETCDGKLMVAGGEGFGIAWPNVDVFDGTLWTSYPELVVGRHGTGLGFLCDCDEVYIASGSPVQGGGDVRSVERLLLSSSGEGRKSSSSRTTCSVRRQLDQEDNERGVRGAF